MKLNIGTGKKGYMNGFINLEISKQYLTDIRGDTRYLPIKNNSIKHIFFSHGLEHFTSKEAVIVLLECYRVLTQDGVLELRVPEVTLADKTEIYGDRSDIWQYHKSVWTVLNKKHYHYLPSFLRKLGYKVIRAVIFEPNDIAIIAVKDIIPNLCFTKSWRGNIIRRTIIDLRCGIDDRSEETNIFLNG